MKKIIIILLTVCILACSLVIGVNAYVILSTQKNILTSDEASTLDEVDCILVLGCLVWDEKTPSHMLEDRLLTAIDLFNNGASPKLLMSGDHGREEYDEVNVMKNFALEKGISPDAVFMDHAGFSTYESIYRAKEIFGVKKMIVVTQGYHLSRALFCAERFGIEAYGVESDLRDYGKSLYNNVRESAARVKDWLFCIIKPELTYLGEKISIKGSGNVTDDK